MGWRKAGQRKNFHNDFIVNILPLPWPGEDCTCKGCCHKRCGTHVDNVQLEMKDLELQGEASKSSKTNECIKSIAEAKRRYIRGLDAAYNRREKRWREEIDLYCPNVSEVSVRVIGIMVDVPPKAAQYGQWAIRHSYG